MKKLINCFLTPIQTKVFYFFLILNLISNGTCIYYYQSINALLFIIFLSFLCAYVESAIYNLFKPKWIRTIYTTIICILYNILILIDYFIIVNFHRIFDEDIIDILLETNKQEIANFTEAYITIPVVIVAILIILLLNCLVRYIAKWISKSFYHKLSLLFSALGLAVITYMCYSYMAYRNGMAIPQYTSITRFAHSTRIAQQRINIIHQLIKSNKKTKATCDDKTKPTVVVIIGESHSLYHSSLYGYPKETNPLLKKRKSNGNLYVFDDVVSVDDHTHGVMKSVFSLDSLGTNFNHTALFPKCFKEAGYYTAMYDNQYFVGNGISFLSNEKLSKMLFNKRNSKNYHYDGDMVDDIEWNDSSSLYVIHLWGQHYTYKHRYPKDNFNIFTPNNYDETKFNNNQKEIIAHYDNACLYNDFVIEQIIKQFEGKNAIIFYFSDHGEEVYELRDYMGHGDAAYSPDLRYQMRVPLLIYVSDSYKQSHADFCDQLEKKQHTPIITDDISHVILNAASIQTESFSKYRCFTDSAYKKDKPRMVLHSIDYNKLK